MENRGKERVKTYVKKQVVDGEVIIAACDENILGLHIVDENIKANFYVDPYFYKGELLDLEEAVKILATATIGNIVGEQIVQAALEMGLIHPEAVLRIKGIPIALFMRI